MRLKFTSLSLEGFKSFVNKQTLRLSLPPGLYFMTGKNKARPELGANAVGKTTVWDALCWCLYGKTLSGLRAVGIASWKSSKRHKVRIGIERDKERFTIIRQWNPNRLQLWEGDKKRTIAQEELEQWLGLTYDEFCHAVVLSQFGTTFLELSPTDKAKLLSAVLDIEVWDRYAEQAGEARSRFEVRLQKAAVQVASLKGQLSQLDTTKLRAEDREWKAQIKISIRKQTTALQTLVKKCEAANATGEALAERVVHYGTKIKKVTKSLSVRKAKLECLADKFVVAKEARDETLVKLKVLDKRCSQFEKLSKAGRCPVCQQKVKAEHMAEELELLQQRRARISRNRLDKDTATVKALIKEEAKVSRVEATLRGRLDNLERKGSDLKRQWTLAVSSYNSLLADERVCKNRLSELKAAVNPYARQLQEAKSQREEVRQQLIQLKAKRDRWEDSEKAAVFWAKEFKAVKLYVLESILRHLEIEVNDSLERLGLIGWSIIFGTNLISKSGSVQKRFNVYVRSPDSKKRVPWEAWSGGERQRLKLAAQLGLSNLILNRKGIWINLQVLDEPTSWLSQEGVSDLMEMLKMWAESTERAVWLLDHRAIGFGGFEGRYRVEKLPKEGSRIVAT